MDGSLGREKVSITNEALLYLLTVPEIACRDKCLNYSMTTTCMGCKWHFKVELLLWPYAVLPGHMTSVFLLCQGKAEFTYSVHRVWKQRTASIKTKKWQGLVCVPDGKQVGWPRNTDVEEPVFNKTTVQELVFNIQITTIYCAHHIPPSAAKSEKKQLCRTLQGRQAGMVETKGCCWIY